MALTVDKLLNIKQKRKEKNNEKIVNRFTRYDSASGNSWMFRLEK